MTASLQSQAALLQSIWVEPSIYLLLRGYAANGGAFDEEAGRFILDHTECFDIGSTPWTIQRVVCSIAPHCSGELLAEIENAILDYYHWKKTKVTGSEFGWSQFVLLSGIPESLRSAKAVKRYQELKRKFIHDPVPPIPMKTEMHPVAAPVPVDAFSKMNDRQWLRAVLKSHDDQSRGWIDDRLVGGAHELSGALSKEAKQDPDLFAALALRFPPQTNTCYFQAVLSGVSDAQESDGGMALYSMIRLCHGLLDRPCGRSIAWATRKHTAELPTDIIEIVSWYAVNDPDPSPDQRLIEPSDLKSTFQNPVGR